MDTWKDLIWENGEGGVRQEGRETTEKSNDEKKRGEREHERRARGERGGI